MKNNIYFYFLFLFIINNSIFSQSDNLSSFTTLSVTYKFHKNWYTNIETQARSIAEFQKIDYYEIKGGIGYNFNSSNQAFIGSGRYANYSKNKLSREELRFWLQYNYSKVISRFKIEQRFRAEKRFFHNPVTDVNTNTERFRYRLNVICPINNTKIEAKTFFVNSYDELFIATDQPTISRNRIYFGGGYQLNTTIGFSLGYLFQRDFSTVNTNTNFLFSGCTITINSKNKATIPTPIETLNAD